MKAKRKWLSLERFFSDHLINGKEFVYGCVWVFANCSDFRKKRNGVFVLGLVFFSSDKFQPFNYLTIFLYHSKGIVALSLNLKKYFTRYHFSYSYGG